MASKIDLRKYFNDFNSKYFDGSLRGWRVSYRSRIPIVRGGPSCGGICLFKSKRIYIRTDQDEQKTLLTLLHEMAHAKSRATHSRKSQPRFEAEMRRLKEAGAPVADREFKEPVPTDRRGYIYQLFDDVAIEGILDFNLATKAVAYECLESMAGLWRKCSKRKARKIFVDARKDVTDMNKRIKEENLKQNRTTIRRSQD